MNDETSLTDRELEVLRQVATGASNRRIGQRLGISPNTVKVHLRNIFEKMGVASRTEATLRAMQMGLVAGIEGAALPEERPWWMGRWVIFMAGSLLVGAALLIGLRAGTDRGPTQPSVDLEALERDRWEILKPMPTPRRGMAVVSYDGMIYAIAGETEAGITDVVERYDPETDSWETLPSKPMAVTDVEAAVIGGKIYVPGGRLPSGESTAITDVFDPIANRWEEGPPFPAPISDYGATSYEGELYVFSATASALESPTLFSYAPGSTGWIDRWKMPNADSSIVSITATEGILFYIGGRQEQWQGQLLLYRPIDTGDGSSGVETEISSSGKHLVDPTVLSFGDFVFVVGLDPDTNETAIVEYVLQDDRWQSVAFPFSATWIDMEAVRYGSSLFMLGGTEMETTSSRNYSYAAVFSLAIPLVR